MAVTFKRTDNRGADGDQRYAIIGPVTAGRARFDGNIRRFVGRPDRLLSRFFVRANLMHGNSPLSSARSKRSRQPKSLLNKIRSHVLPICMIYVAGGLSIVNTASAQSMKDWKACQFGGDGRVQISDSQIELSYGDPLTGIYRSTETNEGDSEKPPRTNYRFTYRAKRTEGFDFFAAATFPVGDGYATFVPGGWGGGVVGLSSINGDDASENETTQFFHFESDRWYEFSIVVTDKNIVCKIDNSQIIDVPREDRKFTLRAEMELCRPYGIASFQSSAIIKDIRIEALDRSQNAGSN